MGRIKSEKARLLAQIKPVIIESLKEAFPSNRELGDNLPIILEKLMQVSFTCDSETYKLGTDFLYEAGRDVESYKQLYSKKLYPHAIYHLQQAVEKAAKGYVLLEGYYKVRELKKITIHQSPQIFLEAVLGETGIKDLAGQLTDETLKTKISDAEVTMSDEDKRLEIARMSYSDILRLLSQIDQYRKIVEQIDKSITDGVQNMITTLLPKPSLFQTISSMTAIFILAIITFPHEAYTRYPDGRMVPRDYTYDLGIVRATPRIMRYLKAEIGKLDKMYKSKRETEGF